MSDFSLFTDRRESAAAAHEGYMLLRTLAPDAVAEAVVSRLRHIDWHHPALVVYREDGDDRWSYVTLGLNTPELGDGD